MKRVARPKSVLFLFLLSITVPAFASGAEREPPAFTIFAAGGKSMENWHGQATFESMHFEWSQPYRWKTQLAFDVAQYAIRQPKSWFGNQYHNGDQYVRAMAVAAILRRTFRPASIVRTYLEIGTGPMVSNQRVPAATSHFNMASQGGFGVIFMTEQNVGLYTGYRFWHVSNGGIVSRNPGYNVHGLVIGSRFVSR